MTIEKKDFIEIEFTGRVKDGEIFDSNIKEDLEKLHQGHNHEIEAKPFIFCIGEGMFLKAIEDFLLGKPDKGHYEIELKPEEAFGNRDPKLIQMIPLKVFAQQKTPPSPGAMFNFDGRIGKTLTVSGGRVMVDFNNPLAGKIVDYRINVNRKITDINEKIKALNEFLFRRDFDFTLNEKKVILKVDKDLKSFAERFRDKFKEILGLDLEIQEKEEPKEVKKDKENNQHKH